MQGIVLRALILAAVVMLSGAIAGVAHVATTALIVEPYIVQTAGSGSPFASWTVSESQIWESPENLARQIISWVASGMYLGLVGGTMFGIVFILARKSLPTRSSVSKGIILGVIMWFVLVIVPYLKYPPMLPETYDPETASLRTAYFTILGAAAGLGAVGFCLIYRRTQRRALVFALYVAFVCVVFLIMPDNPVPTRDIAGLQQFQQVTMVASAVFWVLAGASLGLLWRYCRPLLYEN